MRIGRVSGKSLGQVAPLIASIKLAIHLLLSLLLGADIHSVRAQTDLIGASASQTIRRRRNEIEYLKDEQWMNHERTDAFAF